MAATIIDLQNDPESLIGKLICSVGDSAEQNAIPYNLSKKVMVVLDIMEHDGQMCAQCVVINERGFRGEKPATLKKEKILHGSGDYVDIPDECPRWWKCKH